MSELWIQLWLLATRRQLSASLLLLVLFQFNQVSSETLAYGKDFPLCCWLYCTKLNLGWEIQLLPFVKQLPLACDYSRR